MMFLPITASPLSPPGYKEIHPDKALAPYVRCYWTSWNESEMPATSSTELEKIHSYERFNQYVFAEQTVQNVIAKICAKAVMHAKELFFIQAVQSAQFIIAVLLNTDITAALNVQSFHAKSGKRPATRNSPTKNSKLISKAVLNL